MSLHSAFHKKGFYLLQSEFQRNLQFNKLVFLQVLQKIPEEIWHNRAAHSVWTIEETMSHITSNLELIPQVVKDIRKKRGFINVPHFVTFAFRFLLTRNTLYIISKEDVKKRYETAHENSLNILHTIKDNEWNKGEKFFGNYITIRDIFNSYNTNFQKYIASVTATLEN